MSMATDRIVTLLMTDIEGSAAKWETSPQAMRTAMLRHDEIAVETVRRFGGRLVKQRGEGDSLFTVFNDPVDALLAAAEITRRFEIENWPGDLILEARIGVHSGLVHALDQDLYGPTVNRCARIRGIGHGGQTLVSKATQCLVASRMPSGTRLRDLGIHRLRDLQEPERVFQLEGHVTREFPPLRSLDARPNNLPLQSTSFVGREEEISAVQEALTISRLVTLVGPGGCGKTRLAIQVGAEHRDPFPDGIWFVDLTAHDSEGGISAAIASAVGGDPRNSEPLKAIDAIPEALLVLDNAEHATAAVAKVVSRVLSRVRKIRVLVTSREPLRVAGESQVRVDPLAIPVADSSPEEAAQTASVQLFSERATARLDGFVLSNSNITDVVRICRKLEGIPLAIEQAAGMTPYLTTQEIAERLYETFDVLESDELDVAPRHRTLAATIGWSYSLLSPEEQALFQRLSVFPAPFTMAAAEEVCSDEMVDRKRVFRLLRSLVDKSLVFRREQRDEQEARFRMMDVVSEYAAERLDEQAETYHRRLFEWTRVLLNEASSMPQGSADPSWSRRLESDEPNFRRAIDIGFSLELPETVDMVFNLRHYWLRRGHLAVARGYLLRALAAEPSERKQALLLNTIGAFCWRANDLDDAQAYYEQSLAIQEHLDDAAGAASVLNNLGILASDRGAHSEALRWYERALALIEGQNQTTIVRLTRLNLAMSLVDLDRTAEAEAEMRIALTLSEQESARAQIAFLKASLSDLALRNGRIDESIDLMEEAFRIWEQEMDLFVMAEALVDVSKLALIQGDPTTAITCLGYFNGMLRSTEARPKFRAEKKYNKVREILGNIPLPSIAPPEDLPRTILGILSDIRDKQAMPLLG